MTSPEGRNPSRTEGRSAEGLATNPEGRRPSRGKERSAGSLATSPLRADALRVITALPDSPHRQRFLHLFEPSDPTGDDPTRRDRPVAHITASAVIVDANFEKVLLCLHGRVGRWVQLGGHCEDSDSSLADAALREATEESGIDGLVIHPEPIDLDIHPVNCRYGPAQHYDVRFALLAPPNATFTVSPESKALGWFHPDALPHPLADATERAIARALHFARTLPR